MATETEPSLQALADELAVRGVCDAIDDAVDAKDWERCRALFLEEIEVDFSSLTGAPGARIPADALVEGWRSNLHADKASFHLRTNHQVTLEGERAEVLSKAHALNVLRRELGSDLWETWGYYRHTLERTPEGWRCSGMTYTVAYARGNEAVRTHLPE